MEHDSRSAFGKLLRRLRRAANLSQEALAERAGMSVVTVGALERGIRRSPYRETVDLLLEALAPSEEQAAALIAAAEAERRKGRPAAESLLSGDESDDDLSKVDGRTPRCVLDTAAIRPNASFIGRAEDLALIDSAFERGSEVVVLSGMGGVGKTTLAREYAWRARERYAVAWRVAAHSEAGIIADLTGLGAKLVRGFEEVEDQKAAALRVRDHVLPGLTRPVLLIFDNLEEEALLWEWRPQTGVRVLVTARMRTWSGGAAVVPLGVWSRSEAVEYLRREGDRSEGGDGASGLAEALGDLPLALAHAAAYLRATRTVSPEVYAERIARYLGRTPRGAEYERAVFATFQAGLAQAEEDAPGAAAFLCLAGFFAPDAIPDELLRCVPGDSALRPVLPDAQETADLSTTAADPILVDEALGALDRLSLMTYAPATKSFSAHRLVQAAARDLVAGSAYGWIGAAIAAIADSFPEMRLQNWPRYDALVPHALAVTKHAADAKVDSAALRSVLSICGAYLMERGRDAEGRPLLERAIDGYRTTLQEQTRERAPLDWAKTQHNLGVALWKLGGRESGTARLEEAVLAFRSALEEYTRQRVPLEWAMIQHNLGVALWKLGGRESGTARLEEAVVAFRAALEQRTRERVPLEWARTQHNLGIALHMLGEREGDRALLEEAVAAHSAALEELTREIVPLEWATAHACLAGALANLGERESGTARLVEAVAAYCTALEEQTRERVPVEWARIQSNLGIALWTLGKRESGTARLEEAVVACRAALEEQTRERVPLHWARIQSNLASALSTLGERESGTARLEEAVVACRAALQEQARERVPLHWAITQHNLADALTALGERYAAIGEKTVACSLLRDAVVAAEAAQAVYTDSAAEHFIQLINSSIERARRAHEAASCSIPLEPAPR